MDKSAGKDSSYETEYTQKMPGIEIELEQLKKQNKILESRIIELEEELHLASLAVTNYTEVAPDLVPAIGALWKRTWVLSDDCLELKKQLRTSDSRRKINKLNNK